MAKAALRSRPTPSPVTTALDRLAKLSGAGTAAPRMAREADKIIVEWKLEGLEGDVLRERLETIRDDLSGGVTQAEESAGDVDSSDKGAVRQAQTTLDGLRAAHGAFMAALAG